MDAARARQVEIRDRSRRAKEAAQRIKSETKAIDSALTGLENKATWWDELIQIVTWGMIAAAIAGGIYLLHATGLLYLAKPIVGWLRALVPSPETHRAKQDADAIGQNKATARQREAIAASRASSETYNQAFKRERRKQAKSSSKGNP